MLFLCKFTDYALNLEITENNIYNKDKICLSKIFISKTEIKGGKQRMSKENCESEARKKIAASIGATPEEIYFTSGRADGHLKALKAVVKASKKARPHVIITTMEDPEVLDECSRLERKRRCCDILRSNHNRPCGSSNDRK